MKDVYSLKTTLSAGNMCMKRLEAMGLAAGMVTAGAYLVPRSLIEHQILPISLTLIFVFLAIWRLFYYKLQKTAHFKRRIVILGTSEEARKIAEYLQGYHSLGYEFKGFIDDVYDKPPLGMLPPNILGYCAQLQDIVEREHIDKIVVALSDRRGKLPMETLLACKLHGVEVEEGTTFYEKVCRKIMLENLRPSWLVFSQGFTIAPPLCILKRLVDIFLAVLVLLLTAPLMLTVAILIKLDSAGPVLYRQERVGRYGKVFAVLKFRSMYHDAEAFTGPIFADKHDSRITRVGRVLRTMRVDELPQLFNVLRGEMSFVGPRPERPFFVEQFAKNIPYYTQRHSIRPGITGWAQVCYPYGATAEDAVEKLCLDLYYIKNMSLVLDLRIITKTLQIVVCGKGAR
jgi:sugar transferase (PEP-CTERM system associated)